MTIKEIRAATGLTQKAFAEQYQIPLQTLKQWESDPESSCYRTPPEYLLYLLERAVAEDYEVAPARALSAEGGALG